MLVPDNIKNCDELKKKFKQQYITVTEDDLNCGDGNKKEVMLKNLQHKLGKTTIELQKIILSL